MTGMIEMTGATEMIAAAESLIKKDLNSKLSVVSVSR
jgi:hypothetical protein